MLRSKLRRETEEEKEGWKIFRLLPCEQNGIYLLLVLIFRFFNKNEIF